MLWILAIFGFLDLFLYRNYFFRKVSPPSVIKVPRHTTTGKWRACRRKYRFFACTNEPADHRAIRTPGEKRRAEPPFCFVLGLWVFCFCFVLFFVKRKCLFVLFFFSDKRDGRTDRENRRRRIKASKEVQIGFGWRIEKDDKAEDGWKGFRIRQIFFFFFFLFSCLINWIR